jgi:flagellar hook-basal body complex protein FliE
MNIDSAFSNPVGGIGGLVRTPSSAGNANAVAAGPSFGDTLARALDAVNTLQINAHAGARSLADGSAHNLHDVTIALEQANLSLQLTAQVRNRAVEAYQEIMRMTV